MIVVDYSTSPWTISSAEKGTLRQPRLEEIVRGSEIVELAVQLPAARFVDVDIQQVAQQVIAAVADAHDLMAQAGLSIVSAQAERKEDPGTYLREHALFSAMLKHYHASQVGTLLKDNLSPLFNSMLLRGSSNSTVRKKGANQVVPSARLFDDVLGGIEKCAHNLPAGTLRFYRELYRKVAIVSSARSACNTLANVFFLRLVCPFLSDPNYRALLEGKPRNLPDPTQRMFISISAGVQFLANDNLEKARTHRSACIFFQDEQVNARRLLQVASIIQTLINAPK